MLAGIFQPVTLAGGAGIGQKQLHLHHMKAGFGHIVLEHLHHRVLALVIVQHTLQVEIRHGSHDDLQGSHHGNKTNQQGAQAAAGQKE